MVQTVNFPCQAVHVAHASVLSNSWSRRSISLVKPSMLRMPLFSFSPPAPLRTLPLPPIPPSDLLRGRAPAFDGGRPATEAAAPLFEDKLTFPELETVLVSLPICVLVLSSAAPAVEAFVFVESSIFPPTFLVTVIPPTFFTSRLPSLRFLIFSSFCLASSPFPFAASTSLASDILPPPILLLASPTAPADTGLTPSLPARAPDFF